MKRVEELTLRLLDDDLSEEEASELEGLLADDPRARELHCQLLEQEAALRGSRQVDLADETVQRIDAAVGKRIERKVLAAIGGKAPRDEKGGPVAALPWLAGRRLWQLAAAAAVLLAIVSGGHQAWVHSLSEPPAEALIFGQPQLSPGATAAYRVLVRDGRTQQPQAGVPVKLALLTSDGKQAWTTEAKTDDGGFAQLNEVIPAAFQEGSYTLQVSASVAGESTQLSRPVAVKRSFKLFVSTDKPRYQPGQTIHMRALALRGGDLKPVDGAELLVEVRDAKGNKVFKKKLPSSKYGLGAADFELADQVNQGSYTVSATVGNTSSEQSVTVERYVLPKFKVDLATGATFYKPGAELSGDLRAVYTFGEPVAGATVELIAFEPHAPEAAAGAEPHPFAQVKGRTDAEGRFRFKLKLAQSFVGQKALQGDARVALRATVRDAAGHEQQRILERAVSAQPIRVEAIAERGELVRGVDNIIYLVASYPDGRPAQVKLELSPAPGNGSGRIETSELGVAAITLPAKSLSQRLSVTARDASGEQATSLLSFRLGGGELLLRSDRAVYQSGETLQLTVLPAEQPGPLFVDVVQDGRTVLMKRLERGGDGLALDLPPELYGTLELRAYRLEPDGTIAMDRRLVQVNRAGALAIEARLDRPSYRPGEQAKLALAVKRRDGTPVQTAVSLAGVDEAVFALQQMRPGLERVYFMLQSELLKPRYQIQGQLPPSEALVDAPPDGEPLQQAASLMLANATPADRTLAIAGPESYHARAGRLVQRKRELTSDLLGALALFPVLLFFILTLPLVGFALRRAWRSSPQLNAVPAELPALRRGPRRVMLWWVAALLLPAVSLAVGAAFESELLALVAIGGSALGAVLMLLRAVVLVRRDERLGSLPLARLAPALPAAVVTAWLAIGTLVWASDAPRTLSMDVVMPAYLSMFVAWAVVIGALSVSSRAQIEPVSLGRGLWLLASRGVLSLAPAFIAAVFLVTVGASDMEDMAVQVAARPTMPEGGTGSRAKSDEMTGKGKARGLKAPSRVRRHFPETLLWQPQLITDEQGRAELEIPLADSITTWRLAMSAVSASGELGAGQIGVKVFQEFFVDLDLPVALTQNDVVSVPVAVHNYLDEPQTVELRVVQGDWFELEGAASQRLRLGPKQVTSASFVLVAKKPGSHPLRVEAHGSVEADAVERRVRVEPDGEPVVATINGELSGDVAHRVVIGDDAIEGANDLLLKVYPGSFSQVVEGMDGIFRMPSGCFEQTSSTTYPNVLVLDYMRATKQIKPEIEMKARGFINSGYQRLLSYEVPGGGFEWFGKAPAHTVLTAYGLLEFVDMARVHEVDPEVIARTSEWLLSKQNADGSWPPPVGGIAEGAINHQRGEQLRTTAYIAWALAHAGSKDARLTRALSHVADKTADVDDPYTLALAANALVAAEHPGAAELLERLSKLGKEQDGKVHWESESLGVTYSAGATLHVETTGLAAYALLKAKRHLPTANRALAWLVAMRDPHGTWRSTQATISAMRALLVGSDASASQLEGEVRVVVTVNGRAADALTITPDTSDVFHLLSLRELVTAGSNDVKLTVEGKGKLGYQLVATHYRPRLQGPPTKPSEPLQIGLRYDATQLKVHDVISAEVSLLYTLRGTANMTLVDLGIPPGFEVLPASLDALVASGAIERYTLAGQQLILYVRALQGGKPLRLRYRMRALYPVKVKSPPARTYQYYQPSMSDETEPVELTVL